MPMRTYHAGMQFSLARVAPDKLELASKYDKQQKGYLTFQELSELYVAEKKGVDLLRPEDLPEALALLGMEDLWPQDYLANWTPIYNYQCCIDWRGNFYFGGIGAGNVKTGRRFDYGTNPATELFVICFILDLFSTDYLLENLNEGDVIIGPWGFSGGPTVDGYVTYYPRWRLEIHHRFGTDRRIYPNQLQVTMPLSQALSTANAQGLSIYGVVELSGQTRYINRDNMPFSNFNVPRSALLSSGTP
ncbi:MAG: hypothetical protein U1F76_29790 [Candidatus Competibacteraceae bacterium]